MRSSLLTFATTLLFGLVQAQVPGLPQCAGTCVSNNFGDCGALDAQCICNNANLIAGLACCVSTACDAQGQKATLDFAHGICDPYHAQLPESATCAPGAQSTAAGGSAGTATASGASSSMPATMTSGGSMSESTMASSSGTIAAGGEASSSASGAASQQTGNAGARNEKIEGGLGLGLVVAGLMAAI